MRIELFSGVVSLMDEYEVGINIDLRNILFYEAIMDMSAKFEKSVELRNVPNDAKIPLFSTWYSDHQKLSREKILADCKASKELGLDLIIIDDGWQTDDTSYGYGFCGDYYPSWKKVQDMKQLCQDIHALDMKVMLWYSVAFIGEFSESYNKYKDMTLYYVPAGHYYVLDPRFKEVREFISDFLCRSVKDWDIDGLKLDFIDSFKLPEDKIVREGIDCNSLEESIKLLLLEIKNRLFVIKSNFLIEFRQRYIGPAMKSLGCMYRVGDCPGDFIANRMGIADLRFTSGKFAVHGDPIFFPVYASKEYVACALANSIFGVIQFSVTPDSLNPEQLKVVKNYINFAKKYSDVLLNGQFSIIGGSNAYSECRSTLDGLTIIGYYETKHIVEVDENMIIINGSGVEGIYVKTPNKMLKYTIIDCFGEVSKQGYVEDVAYIDLEAGSMLYL
jgi:alpha-galactosidase